MSKNNLHSIFLNYYLGTMSPDNKKNFESNLEQDPFIKEAYEGFLLLENDSEVISTIENSNLEIKKRLGIDTQKTLFPLKTIITIAASIVLLLGSYFYVSNNKLENNKLATNHTEKIIQEDKQIIHEAEEELEFNKFGTDSLQNNGLVIDNDIVVEDVIIEPQNNKKETKETNNFKAKPVKEKKQIDFEKNISENNSGKIIETGEVSSPSIIAEKTSIQPSALMNSIAINDDELVEYANEIENLSEYKKGIAAYNKSEYSKAIKLFNKSISNNKTINSSTYYIGMSYFNQNKHSKAIKYFDKLLYTSYNNKAEWYKALSLINKGNKTDAKKLLTKIANSNSIFNKSALNKLSSL